MVQSLCEKQSITFWLSTLSYTVLSRNRGACPCKRAHVRFSPWPSPRRALHVHRLCYRLRADARRIDGYPELAGGRGGRIAQGARGCSRCLAPPACHLHQKRSRRELELV